MFTNKNYHFLFFFDIINTHSKAEISKMTESTTKNTIHQVTSTWINQLFKSEDFITEEHKIKKAISAIKRISFDYTIKKNSMDYSIHDQNDNFHGFIDKDAVSHYSDLLNKDNLGFFITSDFFSKNKYNSETLFLSWLIPNEIEGISLKNSDKKDIFYKAFRHILKTS